MTLTFVSAGWTGKGYRLLDAAGSEIGWLDVSNWRDAATLTLGEATYSVRKDPLDGALIVAGPDGLPVAQALRPSLWKPEYDLDWGDGRGRLYRPSAWQPQRCVVDDGDGTGITVHAAFEVTPEVVSGEGFEVRELPPVELAVTTVHHGSMATIGETWEQFMAWIEAKVLNAA